MSSVRFETLEAHTLRARAAGNSHLEGCLASATAVLRSTGCICCPFKDGPVQLAFQFTRTNFSSGDGHRMAQRPSNIVAVVPCKSAGSPVLVQAMSGRDSTHCARRREQGSVAA